MDLDPGDCCPWRRCRRVAAYGCSQAMHWPILWPTSLRRRALLGGAGFFHQAHRAAGNCHALLEILALELRARCTTRPIDGQIEKRSLDRTGMAANKVAAVRLG